MTAAAANFPLTRRGGGASARERPQAGRADRPGRPFTLRLDPAPSPFESLLESILYQQLHGKAAATIHRRVREYFGGDPAPQLLLDTPDECCGRRGFPATRSALKDLAARTLDGTVPTHAAIRK
jgi:DNA-3-methyladenine glycosylase II